MFESLKQNTGMDGIKHGLTLLISLVGHMAGLSLLAILPMIFMSKVQQGELFYILMAPPPPPAPLSPPVPPRMGGHSGSREVAHIDFGLPPAKPIVGIPEAPVEESDISSSFGNVLGTVPGLGGGGNLGVAPTVTDLLPPLEPTPPREPVKPIVRPAPIMRGGEVLEANLIRRVEPVYPRIAIIAHVSGEVKLEATIDEEGNVTNIKVVSGHVLLRDAAVEAVKKWKYRPTILNGEPIAVQGSVRVVFNIL
jgi:periplasmic protein TonB